MSRDLFNEETFRDGAPEFNNGEWKEPETYTPVPESALKNFKMPVQQVQEQVQEEYDIDELTDQVSENEDDEEDFSNVLTDARLRLELGRLYEMVMNHSLFDGVEVDGRAAKIVQKQIRKFAKEQIELTLGMRQETVTPSGAFISSPFNDLEVKVLKKLASAASKGATEAEEANQPVEPPPVPQKKKTLNTINSKPQSRPQTKPQPKPIAKKPEPIQRAPRPQVQQEKPPKELTGKMLHEMTEEEKAEHIRGVNERNRAREQVIPKNRAPWPSYEEQMGMAHAQVSRAAGGTSGISALNGSLSRLVIAGVNKKT